MTLLAGLGGATPVQVELPKENRSRAYRGLLAPGLLYLFVFFVVPVASLLAMSLYEKTPGGDLGDYRAAFRWQNYVAAVMDFYPQILRSLWFAALATVICLLIGYPIAYAIAVRARLRPWLANTLIVLVVAPFFTSFILRTIAWRSILADEGPVVSALQWLRVMPESGRLMATPIAVVCGLAYDFLPFMILPIYASLGRLDPRLLEAGADLYATPFTCFRKVTLPLSMPGVVGGTLLVFIPSMGDYVNASLLGNNTNTSMIGQVIEQRFFRILDFPTAASLSVILMVAILALVAVYVRRAGTEDLL